MRLISRLFLLVVISCFVMWPGETSGQNRRLESAEQAFELHQYHEAIDLYRRAYDRIDDREKRTELLFKIALCYEYTNNHRMAEAWFNRAYRGNYPDPVVRLHLAEAMMKNEKFEEALEHYQAYADEDPDSWRASRGIASARLAMEMVEDPEPHDVEDVRRFNSRYDDYTPAFGDHRGQILIFASSREDAVGDDEDPWTGNQHTSFFVSFQDRAGDWDRPELLDNGPINTEYNEGAPSVNASATEMYFTRCVRADGVDMGCRIFKASREGANWVNPSEVTLTDDSLVTVGHPAISPDGLELYFVSDMEGSIGERDIWVVKRNSTGDQFGRPENLGEVINTEGKEMFPYVREDGTLYFASNGHPGMGGLDIFKTTQGPDGWRKPENIGYPLNSPADDFGIVFKQGDEESGFLSSNRGRRGTYDIYSFYLPPVEFLISGVIRNDSTQQEVPGASVQLVGDDGSLNQAESDQDGMYHFDASMVRENTSYEIIVNKSGYFSGSAQESTKGLERSREFEVDIAIAPIPETAIELPEILYEFDSWELQPQFRDSLQGLVQTMEENPNLVIELASHTDSRGTHEYNDTLSQKRAEAVVDFLVEQGIAEERLEAKGYGKRQPRVMDETIERNGFVFEADTELTEAYIDDLPSEEHREVAYQLNRRTEFRVLREDYEPPEEEEAEVPDTAEPDEEDIRPDPDSDP